ncbi:MAG: hypothetical protein M0Q88_09320 [Bacilli bacterium]|nr:hypothetical protein [Bacilli bacterium]
MSKYRANATDIWKRPLKIRYVWYVETKEKVYVGATWNSLSKALERKVLAVKLCDVIDDKITNLSASNVEDFMDKWRKNYYNPDWRY